jgi:hypothetical protein
LCLDESYAFNYNYIDCMTMFIEHYTVASLDCLALTNLFKPSGSGKSTPCCPCAYASIWVLRLKVKPTLSRNVVFLLYINAINYLNKYKQILLSFTQNCFFGNHGKLFSSLKEQYGKTAISFIRPCISFDRAVFFWGILNKDLGCF